MIDGLKYLILIFLLAVVALPITVYAHEIGHVGVARLTGGDGYYSINLVDKYGLTNTMGGSNLLISIGGVGACFLLAWALLVFGLLTKNTVSFSLCTLSAFIVALSIAGLFSVSGTSDMLYLAKNAGVGFVLLTALLFASIGLFDIMNLKRTVTNSEV
jgi:hypothetical protein